MGGVNKMDQFISNYRAHIRQRKWWWRRKFEYHISFLSSKNILQNHYQSFMGHPLEKFCGICGKIQGKNLQLY